MCYVGWMWACCLLAGSRSFVPGGWLLGFSSVHRCIWGEGVLVAIGCHGREQAVTACHIWSKQKDRVEKRLCLQNTWRRWRR